MNDSMNQKTRFESKFEFFHQIVRVKNMYVKS